jgi:hypothetical protein
MKGRLLNSLHRSGAVGRVFYEVAVLHVEEHVHDNRQGSPSGQPP